MLSLTNDLTPLHPRNNTTYLIHYDNKVVALMSQNRHSINISLLSLPCILPYFFLGKKYLILANIHFFKDFRSQYKEYEILKSDRPGLKHPGLHLHNFCFFMIKYVLHSCFGELNYILMCLA